MKVKITLKRSLIGQKPKARETVRSLGLKKINSSTERELNPMVEGMLHKIEHLVEIEEIKKYEKTKISSFETNTWIYKAKIKKR